MKLKEISKCGIECPFFKKEKICNTQPPHYVCSLSSSNAVQRVITTPERETFPEWCRLKPLFVEGQEKANKPIDFTDVQHANNC